MPGATAGGSSGPPPLPALRVDIATLRRRDLDRAVAAADLPVAWLRAVLGDTDAQVDEPGHTTFDLMLPGSGPVFVDGTLAVAFTVPCGRCLEPAAVDGGSRIQATFEVATSPARSPARGQDDDEDEDGLGLGGDDLDTWTYDGKTIDLGELVAEHVKIAYPMRALCSLEEACQGLCSGCGENMNLVPPQAGCCAKCGQPFAGPVGEPTPEGDDPAGEGGAGADPAAEGPLAAALRKLQLPD